MRNLCLDLKQIGTEGVRFDRPLHLAALAVEGGARIRVSAARLRGEAAPGDRGLHFSAHLDAILGLQCCRCLEGYERPLAVDFVLTLVAEAVEFAAGEAELTDEEISLFHAEKGKADLGEIAREQIYLNLPLKPVCGPECKGLCPTCGVNRNRLECECGGDSVDPRLAPLQELRKRLGGS